MNIIDIAAIVFACTTVNHLRLIAAIENVLNIQLPIIHCSKCFTFWSVLAYGLAESSSADFLPRLLAISLLASYLAIWLELAEGYIDILYNRIYDSLYSTTSSSADDAPSA